MTQAGEKDLHEAYLAYDTGLRRRRLSIACIMGVIGMLAGILLDVILYPLQAGMFFWIRLGSVVFLACTALLLRFGPSLPMWVLKSLGVLSALIMNIAFCLMIYLTDGMLSPYFAAINLVTVAMATMLPWSVMETALMCLGSLSLYAAACFFHPNFSPELVSVLVYNTCFIFISSAVSITITYFLSRARLEEFALRHQLHSKNRELEELDRLKTQFFSNISHELRTPLTLILGPVESLLSRPEHLDSRAREGLVLVQRNSLRLLKLINNLLDLMRLDHGVEILRKSRISPGSYLRGIVNSVRHLGHSKHLEFRVENGDESVVMIADPLRMEKILLNLLTNAIKFTPASGLITVSWKTCGTDVIIEVSDTGIGIPNEEIPKIFDRFHQIEGNPGNLTQGVGIGLALAKDLVTEHGGRIEVESTLGKGSTFRVVIPSDASHTGELPDGTLDPDPGEPFESAFRSADRSWTPTNDDDELLPVVGSGEVTVLVADDEADMLQYVVSLLSDSYRVVQARSGRRIQELVRIHRPVVVILDWMMPVRDGKSLCQQLRSDPETREIKILLVTARIDEESKLAALDAGADDFLTKPFSGVEVKTRLANLVRSAKLQEELRKTNSELAESLRKYSETLIPLGPISPGRVQKIDTLLNQKP